MADQTLKIARDADDKVTLKIAGRTLDLDPVDGDVFVASENLPTLNALASVAVKSPSGMDDTLSAETLFVHVAKDDHVSTLHLHVNASDPVGLFDVLPNGFDRSKGQGHPPAATALAAASISTGFEFRFDVGTARMAVSCATQLPLLDGSTSTGRIEIGLSFPLKDAGHSITLRWDNEPDAVLFAEFLEQMGDNARAGLPGFRIKPRGITHLNGGDTRCHVQIIEPDRFVFDGTVELDWRAGKLWRTQVALAANGQNVGFSDLLAVAGVANTEAIPKVISAGKIQSLAAGLDSDAREFAFTGRATEVLGGNADLAFTYRTGPAPSALAWVDLDNGAAKTLRDMTGILGMSGIAADILPYLPLADLPMQARSFGIDTRGPGIFGQFRLGTATHWADLDVALGKTEDGPKANFAYRAPSEKAHQFSLGEALGSDLMPPTLRDDLNKITRLGAQQSKFADVLLSSVLNEVDIAIAKTAQDGLSADLKGVATVSGLAMRAEMAVKLGGKDKGVRLSMGTVPDNYVTMKGLVDAFGITLDLPANRIPTARLALQDLTIDTSRKMVRLRADATNGYDPVAEKLEPYRCVFDLDIARRDKGVSLTCGVSAESAPVGLRGLARDLQLQPVTDFLKGKGDLLLKSCMIKLDTARKRVELVCGGEIAFGDLIRAAGIKELPHGVPTNLILDGMTLILEGKDKVSVKAGIELKGAQKAEFDLSKDAKLQIARLDVAMKREKKTFEADVTLSGAPQLDLSDDLRFEGYKFKLKYKEDPKKDDKEEKTGKTRTWALGGTLTAHLFGSHEVELAVTADKKAKTRKITLEANAAKLKQLELTTARIAKALNRPVDDAKQIAQALVAAKHIDKSGQLSKDFDSKADGFDLGLPDEFKACSDELLDFLLDTSALFAVSFVGQKMLEIEPHTIKIALEDTEKSRNVSLDVTSDLKVYAPYLAEPVITLKEGKFTMAHKSGQSETTVGFTAKNVTIDQPGLPIMPEFVLPRVDETSDPRHQLRESEESQTPCVTLSSAELSFKKTKKKWKVGGEAGVKFHNLPKQISCLFAETQTLGLSAGNDGITLSGAGMFPLIELPDIAARINEAAGGLGGVRLPELGQAAAQVTKMELSLAKNIRFGIEFGFALPSRLNEVLGMPPTGVQLFRTWAAKKDDMITARLECTQEGVSGQVLGSPFHDDLPGIRVTKTDGELSSVEINFDELFEVRPGGPAFGKLKVRLPSIGLNVTNGSFFAKGGYEFDASTGLRIPFKPLKKILALLGLEEVAKTLPDGFPIKTRKLNKAGITELLGDVGIPRNPVFEEVLGAWDQGLDRFPTRFKEYMQLSVPSKVSFEIAVTGDAGVSFKIAAGERGRCLCENCANGDDADTGTGEGTCQADPDYGLQLMMPTMMGLQGIKLWKMSIGAAFGGAALKGEIDADIDLFDYPTLLASLTVLGDPKVPRDKQPAFVRALPERSEFQRTMVIDDFSYLIIIATIIPIPVPLFYRELSVVSHGIEDMRVEMAVNFPKPSFDLVEAVSFFAEAYKTFSTRDAYFKGVHHPIDIMARSRDETAAPKNMNLTFSAGPIYAQLPRYMANGGELVAIGMQENYQFFDFLNTIKLLWNGGKRLMLGEGPGYLLQAIDIEYRQNDLVLELFQGVKAKASWALATPKEFAEGKNIRLGDEANQRDVAERILTVIGDTKQPLLDGEPVPVSDNGVVLFLHGGFDIQNIMHFVAEGGIMMSPQHGGMMALRMDGRIGPANNALFRAEFDGALIAGKSPPKMAQDVALPVLHDAIGEPTLKVQGNALLEILGVPILTGNLDFRQGDTGAKISVSAGAGLPDRMLCVQAALHGEMTPKKFNLTGDGKIRIAMIEGAGEFAVLATPDTTEIAMSASLEVGPLFNMDFALNAQEADGKTGLVLCFEAELLKLVEIKAQGAFLSGDSVEMSGGLKLLGQEVLSGAMTVTNQACTFSGKLTLIPETPALALSVTGTGTITASCANFNATGKYRFGFVEGNVSICLDVPDPSTRKPQQLSLTLRRFLNTDVDVVMMARAGGIAETLQLSTTVSKPLPLLGDHIKLIDAGTGTKGPSVSLDLNGGGDAFGVQKFEMDGALSVLGMKSATKLLVDTKEETVKADLQIAAPPGLTLPKAGVTFTQSRDSMSVRAKDVSLKVDIASVLAKIVAEVGLGRPNLGALSAEVSMKNMSFEVNRNLTNNPADKEAERRARDAEKRLADLKRLFMAHQATNDELNEQLAEIIADLSALKLSDDDQKLVKRQIETLKSAQENITDRLERFEKATGSLKEFDADLKPQLDELKTREAEIRSVGNSVATLAAAMKARPDEQTLETIINGILPLVRKYPWETFGVRDPDQAEQRLRSEIQHPLWHSYFGLGNHENAKVEFRNFARALAGRVGQAANKVNSSWGKKLTVYRKPLAKVAGEAREAWCKAKKDAEKLIEVEKNRAAKQTLVAAEAKRDAEYTAYENNLKVGKAFGSPTKMGVAAATGYRVHVQAKVQLKLTVGEKTRTFNFLDVNWQVDDIGQLDPHKSILETLPTVILRFLQDNFLTVVGKAITNLFELFKFIHSLISQAVPANSFDASAVSDISAEKMVAGYCQIDPAYAPALAKLNKP